MANFINVADQRLQANEFNGMQCIDVRSNSEFAAGHIPGAINIPLDQLDGRRADISHKMPLLLICQAGSRAAMAANLLSESGQEIFVLDGGTSSWARAGNLLVRCTRSRWSLERQVRLISGLLVLASFGLAFAVHPAFIFLVGLVGIGLTFAGLTDICAMGLLLAKLPWNRAKSGPVQCDVQRTPV